MFFLLVILHSKFQFQKIYTQKYINFSNKSNNKALYKRRKTNNKNLWVRMYSMQIEITIILGIKASNERTQDIHCLSVCPPVYRLVKSWGIQWGAQSLTQRRGTFAVDFVHCECICVCVSTLMKRVWVFIYA